MTDFLLKSTIVMGILFAVYFLLLQKEKMYRFNRFYLLASLLFALSLPLVTIPIYVEIPEAVTPADSFVPADTKPHDIEVSGNGIQTAPVAVTAPVINYWSYIFWGVYSAVSLLFIFRFIYNVRCFYTLKHRSTTATYHGATLVLLPDTVLPYTFLNNIYINKEDFDKALIEPELFTHELCHVKQWHTLDILFVEVIKTFFWFNPLVYLYKKAIQVNHEFLADASVINTYDNIASYQELLLTKAAPSLNYALSSSINFSLTKKRFAMMTKNTSKAKQIFLKLTILPVAAILVYGISTQTVAYAKETKNKPLLIMSNPTDNIEIPNIVEALTEDAVVVQDLSDVKTSTDTVAGDARRDEYFRGVRIVIEDKPNNVFINKPYEELTAEQKRYYLTSVPQKKKKSAGISDSDYEFYFNYPEAIFYIDDRKVTREEVLKRPRTDFSSSGFKFSNAGSKDVKMMFFYTNAFYEKNLRKVNDHYPGEIYKIQVLDKVVDTNKVNIEKKKPGDKSDLQIMEEEFEAQINAPVYPRTEEIQQSSKEISLAFPGGLDTFYDYFYKNVTVPSGVTTDKMYVFFSVNTDGSISDVRVREENPELKKEIERVLLNSPRWIPSQKDGHPVKMSTSITVSFGEKKK